MSSQQIVKILLKNYFPILYINVYFLSCMLWLVVDHNQKV